MTHNKQDGRSLSLSLSRRTWVRTPHVTDSQRGTAVALTHAHNVHSCCRLANTPANQPTNRQLAWGRGAWVGHRMHALCAGVSHCRLIQLDIIEEDSTEPYGGLGGVPGHRLSIRTF